MNTNKFKFIAFMTLFMGLSFFSCKDYLDVNVDPNQSTLSRIDLQLTSAQLQTSIGIGQRIYPLVSEWCQYYTGGPGVSLSDGDQHKMSPSESNEVFRTLYRSSVNLNYIVNSTGQDFYVAVARIMKAYNFGVCADLFGDIPYTEALRGDIADGSILHPHYESAKDVVYPALITELKEAIATIQAGGSFPHPGADDLIYGGDVDNWAIFANTLLLKMYLRTGNYAAATALVDDANGPGFITDNSQNALISFPGGSAGSNPFWNTCKSTSLGNYYIATTTVLNHLTSTLDPRIDLFYDRAVTGSHPGAHYGINPGSIQNEPPGEDYSRPAGAQAANGGLIFSPTAPVIFMSAWEGNLLLAEVEARRNDATAAGDYYAAGVQANFDWLGAGDATSYLTGGGAMDGANMLKSIALQKWTCMNGLQPVESWIETRRVDSPLSIFTTGPDHIFIEPTVNTLGAGIFPSIFPYPENEESLNQNFVAPHDITDKVFWDQ